MQDAIAQVSQDTTLGGVYSEKMWLQYLIWAAEIIIESVQKLGGMYTMRTLTLLWWTRVDF